MIDGFQVGIIFTGFLVASLFFARFWRETRDRLFLFFAVSFFLLAIHQAAFLVVPEHTEARTALYLMRLVVFLVLLGGILDKNRR